MGKEPFSYRVTKNGKLFVYCRGKNGKREIAMKGSRAERPISELPAMNPEQQQLVLARATGNPKTGQRASGRLMHIAGLDTWHSSNWGRR
jgi:hypothetical protein